GPGGEIRPRIFAVLALTDTPGDDLLDADTSQGPPGSGHVRSRRADQAERAAPGEQPSQVGGQRVGQLEGEATDEVPGGECPALAEIDDPLAGGSPRDQLASRARRREREVGGSGPLAISRTDIRVVARERIESGHQTRHEGIL